MTEQITLRKCPHCGGYNYSRLSDCLLCQQPLIKSFDTSEEATIQEGYEHLVMFLEVVSGPVEGGSFQLVNGMVLGRSSRADVQIMSEQASRKHAEITLDSNESWLLTDLGSTNGTFFNDIRIDAPARLNPGDQIKIGDGVFEIKGGK